MRRLSGLTSHDVSELKALRAEDLRDYADRAIDLASGLGDEITVIGILGGGATLTVETILAQLGLMPS